MLRGRGNTAGLPEFLLQLQGTAHVFKPASCTMSHGSLWVSLQWLPRHSTGGVGTPFMDHELQGTA